MFIDFHELFDEGEKRIPVKCLPKNGSKMSKLRSRESITGRAIREALAFMRFIFMSGRKSVTLPFSSRYAFIPSNSVWA